MDKTELKPEYPNQREGSFLDYEWDGYLSVYIFSTNDTIDEVGKWVQENYDCSLETNDEKTRFDSDLLHVDGKLKYRMIAADNSDPEYNESIDEMEAFIQSDLIYEIAGRGGRTLCAIFDHDLDFVPKSVGRKRRPEED